MPVISETDSYDYTLLFEQQAKTSGNDNVKFLHSTSQKGVIRVWKD